MNHGFMHMTNRRHWPRMTIKVFLVFAFFLAAWNISSSFLAGKTLYIPRKFQNVFDKNLDNFYIIKVLDTYKTEALRPPRRPDGATRSDVNSSNVLLLENEQFNYMEETKPELDVIYEEMIENLEETEEFIEPQQPRPMTCDKCFRFDARYLLAANVCSKRQSIKVLFLINSQVQNIKQRHALRKTWLSGTKSETLMAYVFVVGKRPIGEPSGMQEVFQEQKTYGDLLVLDHVDTYRNLTYKTMAALHWATTSCNMAKYVMKVDDDVWVHKDGLINLIEKRLELRPNFQFGGKCEQGQRPHRDKKSKYFVSFRQYPGDKFPPFCSGTAYIAKMATLEAILKISPNIPFFHLEDIYLALCLSELRVSLTNINGFYNVKVPILECKYSSPDVITSHGLSPKEMEFVWTDISCLFFRKKWKKAALQEQSRKFVTPNWNDIVPAQFLKMKMKDLWHHKH